MIRRGARRAALAAALAVAACAGGDDPIRWIRVRAPVGSGLDLHAETLRWEGPVRAARTDAAGGVELAVAVAGAEARVRLTQPGACPAEVTVRADDDAVPELLLAPALAVDDQLQVGFDAPFELTVRHGCPGPSPRPPVWRQIAGPPLDGLETSPDGTALRGRTHALAALRPPPLPWGIVPLSPATRGDYVFEVAVRDDAGAELRATARVTAAARATGVPSVGVDHRLVLGGDGWRVTERPPDSEADVAPGGDRFDELTPDRPGRWRLADRHGNELLVRVGRYDDTPLDCGREQCHPRATREAPASPMTTLFARALNADLGQKLDPRCGLGCHTAGEPGTGDGGFTAVQAALGVALPGRGAPGSWDVLPRALRRLGGVGCTACHGPAAIPMPGAKTTVLRSEVCGVCHDAPPRYGHVAAWRQSRMARADSDERTRAPRCTRCHTTAGFIAWQRVDPPDLPPDLPQSPPPPPAPYVATGVACAACHDPHGGDAGPGLPRAVALPDIAPRTPPWSARILAVCIPCHAPDGGPTASAAALLLGRGGLRVADGEPSRAPAPHGAMAAGCVGCHRGGELAGLERGASHTFRADPASCGGAECHADAATRGPGDERAAAALNARARALLAALAPRLGLDPSPDQPPHATAVIAAPDTPLARAYYDVALVVEDPAAVYHNAGYARALLDEVEAWLATASPTP